MSLSALYTFGTHAVVTYNAEAAKTQIWRPLVAGARPTIGRYHYATPQDPTQLAALYVAPAFSGPLPTGSIYTWVDATPQIEDRPTVSFWSITRTPVVLTGKLGAYQLTVSQFEERPTQNYWPALVSGSTPRIPRLHAVSGQDPAQLSAQYTPAAASFLAVTGKLGSYTVTLPQLDERPTQTVWAAQRAGFTPRSSTVQSAPPQMVDFTLQAQWSRASPALPLVHGPTIAPWPFVPQQFDISVNGTKIVTPSTFSPSATGPVMPNLVGLNYYMALETLQNAGIYLPLVVYAFEPSSISVQWIKSSLPPGIVAGQSLAAGLAALPGQAITLSVSQFPFGSMIDSPPDWKQRN